MEKFVLDITSWHSTEAEACRGRVAGASGVAFRDLLGVVAACVGWGRRIVAVALRRPCRAVRRTFLRFHVCVAEVVVVQDRQVEGHRTWWGLVLMAAACHFDLAWYIGLVLGQHCCGQRGDRGLRHVH